MNQKQAKATRRDIRRSFGTDAFDEIVQMAEQIEVLKVAHISMSEKFAELLAEEAGIRRAALETQQDDHKAFVGRSMVQRWRWLFLGR